METLNGKLAVRICFIQLSFRDGQNVMTNISILNACVTIALKKMTHPTNHKLHFV